MPDEQQGFKKAAKPVNPLLNLSMPNKNAIVYPTPAKDILYVNTKLLMEDKAGIVVNIYNLTGILINNFNINANTLNSIDIANIMEGAYIVEIRSTDNEIIDQSKILIIK